MGSWHSVQDLEMAWTVSLIARGETDLAVHQCPLFLPASLPCCLSVSSLSLAPESDTVDQGGEVSEGQASP